MSRPKRSIVRIPFHLVWATKYRKPLMTPEFRPRIHGLLVHLTQRYRGVRPVACGGLEDHVHLAVIQEHSDVTLKNFMGHLKSVSSAIIHKEMLPGFKWQTGFSSFGFGVDAIGTVCGYIRDQESLHRKKEVKAMEREIYREMGLIELDTFDATFKRKYSPDCLPEPWHPDTED